MRKEIVKKTLSNGITVYLYSDKNLKRFIASYNVKYGNYGYYDKFYYKGKPYHMPYAMAHFLEHTLIEKSKYGNMLLRFTDRSYDTNAGTYPELTSYYYIGIKDTKESLKELINMVDDPAFTKEDIEDEKSAIARELSQVSDEKYRTAYNINARNTEANYETHHESGNVLGTIESTESITYEMAKTCYDAYYNDENKFLVIGGNFKIDEMLEYLEEIYSEIKPHKNEMKPFDYEKKFEVRKEYQELVKPVSEDFYIVTYKFKNDFDMPLYMLGMYFNLFNKLKFNASDDFVTNLTKKGVIVGGIGKRTNFFNGEIMYTLSADVKNGDEFINEIESVLNSNDLDEKQFELYKKEYIVDDIEKMDYPYRALLNFPVHLDFQEKLSMVDFINKANMKDLKRVIDNLDFSTRSITVIKKEEK